MFERIKELFVSGRLSEAGLNKAVAKGCITEAEAEEISGNSDKENPRKEI